MKKKFLGLLLCLLMVLPVMLMAGCSGGTGKSVETTGGASSATSSGRKAMTLTLYAITGESTTEDAIAAVQDKINTITEAQFNTHIILRLYTESKYYDALSEKIKAIEDQIAADEADAAAKKVAAKAAKAAGITTVAETTGEETTPAETDETILNEYGLEKTVYPDEEGGQLDIFLIKGLDNYKSYFKDGVLAQLDEELSVNSKILRDYIYPSFLDAVKLEGGTYAIPNNHMVGQYQFILVNKELYDKYFFDPDNIKDIPSLADFINTVGENEKGYTPVVNTAETYLYYPTGSESLLASYNAGKLAAGASAAPKNLFTIKQFKNVEALMADWNSKGYISTTASVDDGKFGVAFLDGDYSLLSKYKDDYYVTVYKNATFDNSVVFDSMFAVGSYTKNVSRCMQVITALSIDPQLRNIFQYGVEGVNYEIDEFTGYVNILNNDYSMNPLYTGNQFIMWPNSSMTEEELALAANNWELAKQHNLNTSVSPYLGFSINTAVEEEGKDKKSDAAAGDAGAGDTAEKVVYTPTADILAGLEALTKEYLDKLSAFKPTAEGGTAEIEAYIDTLAAEIDANEYMKAALDAENPNSPASQYKTWHDAMYPPAA